MGQGPETLSATATDAAGNTSTAGTQNITVDTAAPTCLIADTTTGIATGAVDFTFTFNEAVSGFTADDVITTGSKGTLNTTDNIVFTMTITPPATGSGTMNVDVTTGNFTDLAGNANTADTAPDPQAYNIASPAGNPTIDLGIGQLIAPVNVDGKWYYVLDLDASGTVGGVNDMVSHDYLDTIFNQDVSGTTNPDLVSGTTDTYRFATLNGVRVALPTIGETPVNQEWHNGTAIATDGVNNPTYDDLLAIWDAFNGAGTGDGSGAGGLPGLPAGWPTGGTDSMYWSSSVAPATGTHMGLNLYYGFVNAGWPENGDDGRYVVLQVL
jgi:hypothetical protein